MDVTDRGVLGAGVQRNPKPTPPGSPVEVGEVGDDLGISIVPRNKPVEYIENIRKWLDAKNLRKFEESCFGIFLGLDKLKYQGHLLYMMYSSIIPASLQSRRLTFALCGKEVELGPAEFHVLTGLSFQGWEKLPETSHFINKHFGGNKIIKFQELYRAFERHCQEWGGGGDDALRFALLVVLYGILMIRHNINVRVEDQYLHLVDDIDKFNRFPWGVLAYDFLVLVGHNAKLRIEHQKLNRKKISVDIHGFGYILQVFAYEIHTKLVGTCACLFDDSVRPRMLRWEPVPNRIPLTEIEPFFRPTYVSDLVCMEFLEGDMFALQANGITQGYECRVPTNILIQHTKLIKDFSTTKQPNRRTMSRKGKGEQKTNLDEGAGCRNAASEEVQIAGVSPEINPPIKVSHAKHATMHRRSAGSPATVLKASSPRSVSKREDIRLGKRRVGDHPNKKGYKGRGNEKMTAARLPTKRQRNKPQKEEVHGTPPIIEAVDSGELPIQSSGGANTQLAEIASVLRQVLERVASIDTNVKKPSFNAHSHKASTKFTEGEASHVQGDVSIELQFAGRELYAGLRQGILEESHRQVLAQSITNAQLTGIGTSKRQRNDTDVGKEVIDIELLGDQDSDNRITRRSRRLKGDMPIRYGVSEGPYPLRTASLDDVAAFEAWYNSNHQDVNSEPLQGMPNVGGRHASWFTQLWISKGWLTSEQIDCLVHLTIARFKKNPEGFIRKWTVVDQISWNGLCSETFGVLRTHAFPCVLGKTPYQLATPWWEADKVVGIAQVSGDHWVCYEVQLDNQHVVVYDSLSISRKPSHVRLSFTKALSNLPWVCQQCKVWENKARKKKTVKRVWDLSIFQHPTQQGDTTNCGIMALKFLECLVTNTPVNALHSSHGDVIRHSYCAELYQYCATP